MNPAERLFKQMFQDLQNLSRSTKDFRHSLKARTSSPISREAWEAFLSALQQYMDEAFECTQEVANANEGETVIPSQSSNQNEEIRAVQGSREAQPAQSRMPHTMDIEGPIRTPVALKTRPTPMDVERHGTVPIGGEGYESLSKPLADWQKPDRQQAYINRQTDHQQMTLLQGMIPMMDARRPRTLLDQELEHMDEEALHLARRPSDAFRTPVHGTKNIVVKVPTNQGSGLTGDQNLHSCCEGQHEEAQQYSMGSNPEQYFGKRKPLPAEAEQHECDYCRPMIFNLPSQADEQSRSKTNTKKAKSSARRVKSTKMKHVPAGQPRPALNPNCACDDCRGRRIKTAHITHRELVLACNIWGCKKSVKIDCQSRFSVSDEIQKAVKQRKVRKGQMKSLVANILHQIRTQIRNLRPEASLLERAHAKHHEIPHENKTSRPSLSDPEDMIPAENPQIPTQTGRKTERHESQVQNTNVEDSDSDLEEFLADGQED